MYFITFEGPEGSGKTTQLPAVAAWLREQGYDVFVTREPGGTPIGDQIRQVIMGMENKALVAEAEILLFSASRAQLVREKIRPALEAGQLVLCDRYADSTLAYQGYGHGLPLELLRAITEFATGGLKPHLTLLLDLDPAVGLQRRQSAVADGAEWNRLDDQALSFHKRTRAGYHALAVEEPERWRIVDASQPPDAVQQALRQQVSKFLGIGG
jgi:dTMP kinase